MQAVPFTHARCLQRAHMAVGPAGRLLGSKALHAVGLRPLQMLGQYGGGSQSKLFQVSATAATEATAESYQYQAEVGF